MRSSGKLGENTSVDEMKYSLEQNFLLRKIQINNTEIL